MNVLVALWVCASAGVAVYALLTLPTWLLGSMNRSTLWRLRDRVFDERRSGRLPDTEDVQEFITYLETLIIVLPKISAFQVWWFNRFHGHLLPASTRPEALLDQRCPARFQDVLHRIILRQYFVGSWSGLVLLVRAPGTWSALRAVSSQSRPEQIEPDERRREQEVITEVERVVPHLGKRTDDDLIAAAG